MSELSWEEHNARKNHDALQRMISAHGLGWTHNPGGIAVFRPGHEDENDCQLSGYDTAADVSKLGAWIDAGAIEETPEHQRKRGIDEARYRFRHAMEWLEMYDQPELRRAFLEELARITNEALHSGPSL